MFGQKRIRELEALLKQERERFVNLEWAYTLQVERRLRDLEMRTGLTPLSDGIGIWKKGEMPSAVNNGGE